ncbi:MAG TPA: electron transfer flavoprotein subunit beta/FixA family protein [Candidatus Thermoplasmatota archaeon]|nr:electron transfer flavoprotein subunit beta/FixA family protein [Candidatus Thermoplasmatota archaeon]
MVNVVVCIKAVPSDLNVAVSRRTGEPILEGTRWVINNWEKRAIALGIELVKNHGGACTVVTMDEESSKVALREALALGADKAVLLTDKSFEGADTLATARVLSAALTKLRADVVLTGSRTADRRSAQVGPMVAQLLNIPAVTFAESTELKGKTLHVTKRIGTKLATYEAPLPCLVSVGADRAAPAIATAWGIYDAYTTKDIIVWNRRDLDLHEDSVGREGSPTRVRRFEKVQERKGPIECEFFEGDADDVARQFVRRLKSRGGNIR